MNYNNTYRVRAALHGNSENVDKSKTLQAWQARCQIARNAILVLRGEHERDCAPLYTKYLPSVADKMAAEAWEPVQNAIRERVNELKEDLQTVIDGKQEQFRRVALSAPDEETTRLLTVLNLRDNVSEDELARIAEAMIGNFQGLLALRSIARRSGVSMPEPPTVAEFEDSLSRATEFCQKMLTQIDAPNETLTYHERCFYDYDGVGLPHVLFDELDNRLHYTVQLQPVEEAEDTTSETSE